MCRVFAQVSFTRDVRDSHKDQENCTPPHVECLVKAWQRSQRRSRGCNQLNTVTTRARQRQTGRRRQERHDDDVRQHSLCEGAKKTDVLVALNIHATHASSTTSVTNGLVSSTSDVLRHSHPPQRRPNRPRQPRHNRLSNFNCTSPVSEVEHTVPLARCVRTHTRTCVRVRSTV